jgi:energy-coupling factor transporter transmembrane protein EcfT
MFKYHQLAIWYSCFCIGVVNALSGNDSFFGVFIILLSFVYFLRVNAILKKMTGFSFPTMGIVKILLGIFILWASFGVGELFDKIELMKMDL